MVTLLPRCRPYGILETKKNDSISFEFFSSLYLGSAEKVRSELNSRHSKEDSTIVQPLCCNDEVDLFLANKPQLHRCKFKCKVILLFNRKSLHFNRIKSSQSHLNQLICVFQLTLPTFKPSEILALRLRIKIQAFLMMIFA